MFFLLLFISAVSIGNTRLVGLVSSLRFSPTSTSAFNSSHLRSDWYCHWFAATHTLSHSYLLPGSRPLRETRNILPDWDLLPAHGVPPPPKLLPVPLQGHIPLCSADALDDTCLFNLYISCSRYRSEISCLSAILVIDTGPSPPCCARSIQVRAVRIFLL